MSTASILLPPEQGEVMSQFFQVHPENPQARLIKQAVEIIRGGGVVVYPTDSSYAIGCLIGDKGAVERIRRLRQLDDKHNFTLVCSDLSQIGLFAKVDTGAAARAAESLGSKEAFDVLVVGGGPAGASAAIYAARKGIRTGVLAERFGGQVMDTLGIENFISVKETEGPKLVAALEQHVKQYEVDVMNLQRAAKLIPASTAGGLIEVQLENGASLKSKSVILATGARWREMNVPGEKDYKAKGVCFCPHCDGPLFKGKRVAVIGGGNSGVEAAIDLAGIVGHVTLLEFADTLRADAVLQKKLFSLPNVTVIKSAQTTEVTGDGQKVNGITYKDRVSEEIRHVELEGIFVQIGLLPNTDWLKDTVDLSKFGEIQIDAKGHTSVPGVFAAGDCTTVPYKQIIIAMGAGATASLSAFDHLIRH